MTARELFNLCRDAFDSWTNDYASSMGAALAYYTVFSVAPLLLIVISVAGLVFGQEAARGEIFAQLSGLMGAQGALAVQGMLEAVNKPTEGIIATVIGIALLVVGATTVFGELQNAMDRIWRAPARHTAGGVVGLLRVRLLSFSMIMGIGFLLMVSLVASAAIAAFGKWWAPVFGGWEMLAQGVNFVFSFAMVTVIFAMIYKLMPRVKVEWRDVWVGAGVTALLFTVGKHLIGLYIGKSSVASGYGAAGSLVVVLVWVYYSAQIFLLGAEFTWVYAHTMGSLKGQVRPGSEAAIAEAAVLSRADTPGG
ncbi:YihY/virulence factor BrkB family protein [Variovorax sp. PAMC 28711]|uniref:YihY/virulence factor BrkB family protein n=1 Tax=Variovorax sp. PAMC 28711 TaxID=1795631 RepID=UPI000AE906DF|nr:YihY/virulence factor BrkB family protein [Variovorax sp. PAMC 28711]